VKGEMKAVEGWIDIKIRDLFSSSTPGDWGKDGNQEDGVPVLRSTNFCNNGSIDYSDIAYREVDETRLKKRRVDKGTILIEKSGGSPSQAAGRVVYCDREFNGTASNFIEVVKVKDDFSPRYVAFLLYYLYQIGIVLKYQQQTTGIINFKLNEYSEEMVNCPASKPEQAKIAEILSSVDRAIEQTEALIAKQQRIKTGLMQDLLTRGIDEHGNLRSEETHKFKDSPLGRIPVEWEVRRLTESCDICNNFRKPIAALVRETMKGEYPYYGPTGILH
jgi:type I restriction enzyme S subunit